MQPFRYHVLACDQTKPDGLPCCRSRGSAAVLEALRRELGAQQLLDTVQLTITGSLGLCERGPNLVVYPDGVWYSGVTPADVKEIVAEHFAMGRPVERLMHRDEAAVKKEIVTNRGRMLAALAVREAAGVMPDELMEMIRGYQASRILLSAVELDVFSAIAQAGDEATLPRIAQAIGANPRGAETLLNALVALGTLSKAQGVFANTPPSLRFLSDGSPDDARVALRHNLSLWSAWSTLTDAVRAGHAVDWGEMASRDEDWTLPFIAAMHRNAALRAPLVVAAVGTEGVHRLLDIGGGSGAYSIAFTRQSPSLMAEVFDLATVVPIAAWHIAQAELGDRITTTVGDLTNDQFGTGYDLALLSAICHMLGPEENRDLFQRVHAALSSGGRVVIQDHVMEDDHTQPRAGALFAINMLVGTLGGGTYSQAEYRSMLETAGFVEVRLVPLPGPNDLMVARKA